MKKSAYVHNVDELIAETPLDSVLIHYGLSPSNRTSGEVRMPCMFNESCNNSSYGQLAISAAHPAKQVFCHVCGTRGKPIKHKFVKGYGRGLELYGQQTARLEEASIRESLNRHGLLVVEGANDVIALDALGLAAVGLCSNRATEHQVEKIVRFASSASNGRVTLLPDNDEEGENGFRELLWSLVDRGINVRLGWSRTRENGRYTGLQPEAIDAELWAQIAQTIAPSVGDIHVQRQT